MKTKFFMLMSTVIVCLMLNITTTSVKAANIKLPQKYTNHLVYKASRNDKQAVNKLRTISRQGMKNNNDWQDFKPGDDMTINPAHLSKKDQLEMQQYSLNLINKVRLQRHRVKWRSSSRATHFANSVAHNYYVDNMSCWDDDHDVKGILKAAKKHGLNYHLGQVYEDEAGLPITNPKNHLETKTQLKKDLYFNIKQMLFGGFYGNNTDDLSRYFEYAHARDLLSLGENKQFARREFGLSFSGLKNDPTRVSVHMLGVPKPYIQNYKKFK